MPNHSGRLLAAPVREHDGRRTMRSLADALARLRECDELAEEEHVEIRTNPVRLPNGQQSGFVVVIGPPRPAGAISVVRMPSAAEFSASPTFGERRRYPIGMLNGAVCDCDGNVQLATGEYVHAVKLMPATVHYELTVLEQIIVRLALKCLDEEDRCCPPLHPLLPGVRPPRYNAIAGIRVKRLKAVQSYVANRVPILSPFVVAKALRRAGMKLPRAASQDDAATIAP
jgi:hypothetical protein